MEAEGEREVMEIARWPVLVGVSGVTGRAEGPPGGLRPPEEG